MVQGRRQATRPTSGEPRHPHWHQKTALVLRCRLSAVGIRQGSHAQLIGQRRSSHNHQERTIQSPKRSTRIIAASDSLSPGPRTRTWPTFLACFIDSTPRKGQPILVRCNANNKATYPPPPPILFIPPPMPPPILNANERENTRWLSQDSPERKTKRKTTADNDASDADSAQKVPHRLQETALVDPRWAGWQSSDGVRQCCRESLVHPRSSSKSNRKCPVQSRPAVLPQHRDCQRCSRTAEQRTTSAEERPYYLNALRRLHCFAPGLEGSRVSCDAQRKQGKLTLHLHPCRRPFRRPSCLRLPSPCLCWHLPSRHPF